MKESSPVSGPPDARQANRMSGIFRPGLAFSGGIIAITFIALLFLAALACLLSKTPGRALYFYFVGPFRSAYSLGALLNGAIPLILGGLGVSVAMRAGSLNLGGEGQIYSGAFAATAAALALERFGFFGGLAAVCAGVFFAGAAASFSGFCKARWNTNELITSFLLSNALILIVNYLVNGPFLDPETNLQSTRKIAAGLRLPRFWPPADVSSALPVAVAAAAAVYFFLKETKLGYELRMAGANEMFARYGGINTRLNTVLAMFLSGAFYGLAGALAVFGTYYGTVKEFSSGLGWNGLAAALMADFNPLAVIPASLFLSWISTGAKIAMQNSDITFETASVVQSVIFFLATSAVLRGLFKKKGGL
ncbi:MAG: ABC transporter permease [Treponema sp.]|nr:ABC transporter permease [Treponema sp.]MCL2126650.1 ABC transporter permease [Treponema sp.]